MSRLDQLCLMLRNPWRLASFAKHTARGKTAKGEFDEKINCP